jgi:hypothetical protein
VTLNGKPVTDWKISHSDIMRGGDWSLLTVAIGRSLSRLPGGKC